MEKDLGVLTPFRRRWAWIAFVALLVYVPVVAYLMNGPLALYTIPHDAWTLPATVAGLVGFVLIVDDVERHKAARHAKAATDLAAAATQTESAAEPVE